MALAIEVVEYSTEAHDQIRVQWASGQEIHTQWPPVPGFPATNKADIDEWLAVNTPTPYADTQMAADRAAMVAARDTMMTEYLAILDTLGFSEPVGYDECAAPLQALADQAIADNDMAAYHQVNGMTHRLAYLASKLFS